MHADNTEWFFMPCIGWWCFNLFGAILLGEGGGAKAPNYLFPSVCLQLLCLSMASFWTPIYDHILPKLAWYITLRDRSFVIYGEGMCFSVADAENCPTHLLVHQKYPPSPFKDQWYMHIYSLPYVRRKYISIYTLFYKKLREEVRAQSFLAR